MILPGAFSAAPLLAQDVVAEEDTVTQREEASNGISPLVYLDCNRCDRNHIRREVSFVNYVRDPEQAETHLFITDQQTGDGGREYELSFIGQKRFSDVQYSFKKLIHRDATWDETREELNRAIKMGLLPYAMQTPLANRFNLEYVFDEGSDNALRSIENDPWKQWVFEIYAGSLSLDMESNQTEFDSRWGFFADKVTENWKVRFRPYFNYDYTEIQRKDEEAVIRRRHRHGVDSYAIKSISRHWSAGLFGDYLTRNDQNIKHRFRLNPGIEYSLFPYEVATRKSITAVYQLGYSYAEYDERTIFDKTRESLLNHELSASVGIEQPWGSINSGLVGSHYFHDFDKRRAEFFGDISVRIIEGLSLNFWISFEMINDQLSLPIGDATLEEVLLNQRELSTDYELSGSISISYTFGSDFANIVNTRF